MCQRYLQLMWAVMHTIAMLESQPRRCLIDGCLLHLGCATAMWGCELDGIGGDEPPRCCDEPVAYTRRVDWYLDSPVALAKNEHSTRYLLCKVRRGISVGDTNIQSLSVAHPMTRCQRT